ncbi:ExbD/TolR family protein [Natronogracilivirga saccharolytica]|uniref:Biopolymer transporter ExbD n=1 Tax=Natronogracilivirga saccharolytica TaxID=2812953 RepID=A0A8J7UUA9_9BACT|nr:biopolymer transporter ExbD [Natronogracilivirga saccharolytica]MBP3192230.1 biopolymer transporter ExbD [Natronogracilivirga saccharolytica]
MSKFQKKQANTKQQVPTAAMPDIIFMLLIFFMVVTVLREVELQVRVDFTRADNIETIEQKRLVSYIYIGPEILGGGQYGDTRVQIDDALIDDIHSIRRLMYDKLQEEPRLIVSLRVDQQSEMGIVSDVQEELREAGTLRINYSTLRGDEAVAM